MPEKPNAPGAFKGQPWTLFDSVAALSFLLGDTSQAGLAIGSRIPAINRAGEMIFFSAGRTRSSVEHLTNIDQDAQMAYGIEIWQMYIVTKAPIMPTYQSDGGMDGDPPDFYGATGAMSSAHKLMETIIKYGVLQLTVGQEEQIFFPLDRFGSGGGAAFIYELANGLPFGANVMVLPEPISIPRTQNLNAKIKLMPEVHTLIGTPAAPGVGTPLQPYQLTYWDGEAPAVVSLPQPPFMVQVGLQGRRVKDTQYGQIAPTRAGA